MHMNLDKKVAGVKTKYLLIGIPVVIIGALYLRSRSASSTGSSVDPTSGTDAGVDAGIPGTTGSGAAGSGSDFGGTPATTTDTGDGANSSTPAYDPGTELSGVFQAENDYLTQLQAEIGSAGAVTPSGIDDLVGHETLTPGAGAIKTKPPVSKPKKKKPTVRGGAATLTHGTPAPGHPDQHKTAAAPSHAKPPTPAQRTTPKPPAKTPPHPAPKKPTPPPKKPAPKAAAKPKAAVGVHHA